MNEKNGGIVDFLLEMSAQQTSIKYLFSRELLISIRKHLGIKKSIILCFDQYNNFLSWTDENGIKLNAQAQPYINFASNDVVEHVVYYTSAREKMTYFNSVPKVYKSTDIINPVDYDSSAYVRFIEENIGAHYSAVLPFGQFGCIQMMFFKTQEEGDFTQEEMLELENLYVIIANSYINFKKHEQAMIISDLKDRVITSSGNAYFVIDGFNHILIYNKPALECLQDVFAVGSEEELSPERTQPWIPMLLKNYDPDSSGSNKELTFDIRNYSFAVYPHEQVYEHKIIERYFLITINESGERKTNEPVSPAFLSVLTETEQRVSKLLGIGMTYKEIAEEMTVSYHTVKKHVENIYTKLNVTNRYQLYEMMKK